MKKNIILVLLLVSLCFVISNVYAVDYTEYPYNERETQIVGTPNEPADSSNYTVDKNSSLEGGGTFKPVEIWGFRLFIIIVIGGLTYLVVMKKMSKAKKSEASFYEE